MESDLRDSRNLTVLKFRTLNFLLLKILIMIGIETIEETKVLE